MVPYFGLALALRHQGSVGIAAHPGHKGRQHYAQQIGLHVADEDRRLQLDGCG